MRSKHLLAAAEPKKFQLAGAALVSYMAVSQNIPMARPCAIGMEQAPFHTPMELDPGFLAPPGTLSIDWAQFSVPVAPKTSPVDLT